MREILGVAEQRLARRIEQPADVIGVDVGDQHQVDVGGVDAGLRQGFRQASGRAHRRAVRAGGLAHARIDDQAPTVRQDDVET